MKGVYKVPIKTHKTKRWQARLCFKGKTINLGYFSTEEEAGQAYSQATSTSEYISRKQNNKKIIMFRLSPAAINLLKEKAILFKCSRTRLLENCAKSLESEYETFLTNQTGELPCINL